MEEQKGEINDWMKEVKAPSPLPNGKGIVKAIHPPQPIETKYGKRFVSQVVIEGSDNSVINVRLFLPAQFPLLHPKSNLAKILAYNGCTGLLELIGKEVEVEEVGDMMWNLKGGD